MRKVALFILILIITLQIQLPTGLCNLLIYYMDNKDDTFLLQAKVDESKISATEKSYCLDLLSEFENIISNKSFDELTEQEKETVRKFHFAFLQTNICTARIWNDMFVATSHWFDKLPDDKISLFLHPRTFGECGITCGYDKNLKETLPLIENYIPECRDKNFGAKVDCFSKSGVYIGYYRVVLDKSSTAYPIRNLIIPLLIKVKNKDKVNVFLFKGSFTMTFPNFEKKMKKFEEEVRNKPVCMLTWGKITCPFLHLEKNVYPPVVNAAGSFGGIFAVDISGYKKRECDDLSCLNLSELTKSSRNLLELDNLYKKLLGEPDEKIKIIEEHIKNNLKTDFCSVKIKRVKIEEGLLANYYSFVLLDKEQKCRNYIDLLIKIDYEYIKEMYNWLKKELGTRGYIN